MRSVSPCFINESIASFGASSLHLLLLHLRGGPACLGCINGGSNSWMVYNGKFIYKWMIWGYLHFRKPPYNYRTNSNKTHNATMTPFLDLDLSWGSRKARGTRRTSLKSYGQRPVHGSFLKVHPEPRHPFFRQKAIIASHHPVFNHVQSSFPATI